MCDHLFFANLNYVNWKWLDAKNVNKAYFKHKNLNNVNPKNWNEWYENVTMRACIPRNPQKETNRQQKKEKKSSILDSSFIKWLSLITDHPSISSGVISLTK